jgi:Putative transposase
VSTRPPPSPSLRPRFCSAPVCSPFWGRAPELGAGAAPSAICRSGRFFAARATVPRRGDLGLRPTGAVTLIQRFGSALNLNIHFHALVLDGAYLVDTEPPVFRRIEPPRQEELQALVERMAERIGRALERQGVLARDAESSYLELDSAAGGSLDDLIGHSIPYRVAVGPRAGQKVFSLQSVPARADEPKKEVAQYAGSRCTLGLGLKPSSGGSSNDWRAT